MREYIRNSNSISAVSAERSDHSIMNSSMHVIWARGQRADTYYHRPTAGVDNPNLNISDTNYYKRDELKYHGQYSANNNRGFTTINFYGESTSVYMYFFF